MDLSSEVLLRVQGTLKVSIEHSNSQDELKNNIEDAFTLLHQMIFLRPPVFHVKDTKVLLRRGGEGGGAVGNWSRDVLKQTPLPPQYKRMKHVQKHVYVPVGLMIPMSSEKEEPATTLVISHAAREFSSRQVRLHVDYLVSVTSDTPHSDLYKSLQTSLRAQLDLMRDCLLKHATPSRLPVPRPYHFRPPELENFVTAVYPASFSDDENSTDREALHETHGLSRDWPVMRLGNAFRFPQDTTDGAALVSPHLACPSPNVEGGETYTVQGDYVYHHYMQDRLDDNGWGCAYRSLQTLASWFKLQGYTALSAPSHRLIQQTLVDIGDKEAKFVGSKQWIGSSEVGFCLTNLLGVEYKILFVSSGAEMGSKARELVAHFRDEGTPVMIGGGVLAHTILGVCYNSSTGGVKFLILDPHYTGGEDIGTIVDKGWCGWKGPDFWDQTAYYNMCMPQRHLTF